MLCLGSGSLPHWPHFGSPIRSRRRTDGAERPTISEGPDLLCLRKFQRILGKLKTLGWEKS